MMGAMLTFTTLGGTAIRMQAGKMTLFVHVEKKEKPQDNEIFLLRSPEEEPREGVISWPGEYDVDSVAVQGIGQEEGAAVSYAIDAEDMRTAFLYSPLKEWSESQIELLGNVDVLFIPTDNPKVLQKLIDEIDPRVLVLLDTGGKEKNEEALKVCGALGKEPVEQLEVKAGSLPQEGRETVVMRKK